MPKVGSNGQGSKRTLGGHDPLVCGIGRAFDCDGCLAKRASLMEMGSPHQEAEAKWEQVCRVWPELRKAERRTNPDRQPRSVGPALLGKVVWTLLQPEHRAALRMLLMHLLTEPICELLVEVEKVKARQVKVDKKAARKAKKGTK